MVPMEIPYKMIYPYIESCAFYSQVTIWDFLGLRACKPFWNAPWTHGKDKIMAEVCALGVLLVAGDLAVQWARVSTAMLLTYSPSLFLFQHLKGELNAFLPLKPSRWKSIVVQVGRRPGRRLLLILWKTYLWNHWMAFFIQSSMNVSTPVVVQHQGHLFICLIRACPSANNLSNLVPEGVQTLRNAYLCQGHLPICPLWAGQCWPISMLSYGVTSPQWVKWLPCINTPFTNSGWLNLCLSHLSYIA